VTRLKIAPSALPLTASRRPRAAPSRWRPRWTRRPLGAGLVTTMICGEPTVELAAQERVHRAEQQAKHQADQEVRLPARQDRALGSSAASIEPPGGRPDTGASGSSMLLACAASATTRRRRGSGRLRGAGPGGLPDLASTIAGNLTSWRVQASSPGVRSVGWVAEFGRTPLRRWPPTLVDALLLTEAEIRDAQPHAAHGRWGLLRARLRRLGLGLRDVPRACMIIRRARRESVAGR
jgi:hypothetical protein